MQKNHHPLTDKKILVFQKSGFIGGAEKNLQRWVDFFKRKFNVSVSLCGPGRGPFFEEMASNGINILSSDLPDWRKGKNFLRRYRVRSKIASCVGEIGSFDLIFSNDFFYAPYAVYVGKKLNIPVVVHIQSDCEPKRISQYSLDQATKVIITTRSTYAKINPYFRPYVLERIPYGVENPSPITKRDPRFRSDPQNKSFGVAANLLPHKGLDFIFELAEELLTTPGWEIHWVGGDPQNRRDTLRSKAKSAGLENRLFFHDFFNDMDVFYDSIDCLIHPAQYEPFGLVLIEAMSHGVPVISTRTSGGMEILGDIEEGDWLVERDGWKQMAQKMKKVIQMREGLETLGKKFEEKFQKDFSFSAAMDKMESLFSNILGRPSLSDHL